MLNIHETVLIFDTWNMINISINGYNFHFIIILIGQVLDCDLVVVANLILRSIIVAGASPIVRCKF